MDEVFYDPDDVMYIQVCDGDDGCGRVIADNYAAPQRCSWQNHRHQEKYAGKLDNAPLMRPIKVVEVP